MSCPRPTTLSSALLVGVIATVLSACGGDGGSAGGVVVRDPDDVRVLTPAEVEELREGTASAAEAGAGATGETIPLEEVDPTERLFNAFSEFNGCMEDSGQPFRGDPRSDPALLEDQAYMDAIVPCAARSDIVGALEALQAFNADLTPEEVEERNEQFLEFKDCLVERGWTIEAAPDAKGLLTPSQFAGPDGELDERDMRQCGSEVQS